MSRRSSHSTASGSPGLEPAARRHGPRPRGAVGHRCGGRPRATSRRSHSSGRLEASLRSRLSACCFLMHLLRLLRRHAWLLRRSRCRCHWTLVGAWPRQTPAREQMVVRLRELDRGHELELADWALCGQLRVRRLALRASVRRLAHAPSSHRRLAHSPALGPPAAAGTGSRRE